MSIFKFGKFHYHVDACLLIHAGEAQSFRPKTASLMAHFLTHPGQVFSRDDLLEEIWPDQAVVGNNLVQSIRELRIALGDNARQPQFIETVAKRGYQWVCEPVQELEELPDNLKVHLVQPELEFYPEIPFFPSIGDLEQWERGKLQDYGESESKSEPKSQVRSYIWSITALLIIVVAATWVMSGRWFGQQEIEDTTKEPWEQVITTTPPMILIFPLVFDQTAGLSPEEQNKIHEKLVEALNKVNNLPHQWSQSEPEHWRDELQASEAQRAVQTRLYSGSIGLRMEMRVFDRSKLVHRILVDLPSFKGLEKVIIRALEGLTGIGTPLSQQLYMYAPQESVTTTTAVGWQKLWEEGPKTALRLFSQALAEDAEFAPALEGKALALMHLARFSESLKCFQRLSDLPIMQSGSGRVRVLVGLGQWHLLTGAFDQAVTELNTARELAMHGHYRLLEARAIGLLAQLQSYQGHWSQAEDRYRRMLTIYEQLADKRGQAYGYYRLGSSFLNHLERGAASLQYLRDALSLYSEVGDLHGAGQVYLALSRHTDGGDVALNISMAIHAFSKTGTRLSLIQARARELAHDLPPSSLAKGFQSLCLELETLGAYTALGGMYRLATITLMASADAGHEEALAYAETFSRQALQMGQQLQIRVNIHNAEEHLAVVAFLRDEGAKGMQWLQRARQGFRELQLPRREARTLLIMAYRHVLAKDWKSALVHFHEVSLLLDRPHPLLPKLRAHCYYSLGDYQQAYADYAHFRDLSGDTFGPDHQLRLEAYERTLKGAPPEALDVETVSYHAF